MIRYLKRGRDVQARNAHDSIVCGTVEGAIRGIESRGDTAGRDCHGEQAHLRVRRCGGRTELAWYAPVPALHE